MADVKALKKQIWQLGEKIKAIEADRDQWTGTLPEMERMLANDPTNEELLIMRADTDAQIAGLDNELAPLREELAALQAQLPEQKPKFDPEKHPLLKKSLEKQEPIGPVTFNVGDECEAQWEDKLWYKAKVLTLLGSGSMLKYYIKFVEYDETKTVGRNEVRPTQKRKREPEPAPAPPAATSTPTVISAPAVVNSASQPPPPPLASDAPRKKKKAAPEFNKRVNSWKDWSTKGAGKKIAQKDSMFRTGTGVNSRVGVTGSGAGMTTIGQRKRYDKKLDEKLDEKTGGTGE
ncbi:hypothetical protein BS50DRAFT_568955 [Corynespora cassiicola Philippines]|uniref:Tudor domain-containing protein n=1 Tax=Corynespora cassiicola Philippines TaxID=1448308 RepID=A0A2T2P6U7_CORCC|nr:hypothetical protein BS50DRAFT_568955 [Corynespora cassiicola Philippines]